MKNRILLSILFITSLLTLRAQDFYKPSDISVTWYQGSLQNIGIGNNQDDVIYIPVTAQPRIRDAGASPVLSFLIKNKFICLEFMQWFSNGSNHHAIIMYYQGDNQDITGAFPNIQYLFVQEWYNVDFENIYYDEATDNIVIPCSYGYPQDIYIIIGLGNNATIKTISDDADTEPMYFNVQGQRKELSSGTNEILIKKQGNKAEKILNK